MDMVPAKCLNCNIYFQAKTARAQFCSPKCRVTHNRRNVTQSEAKVPLQDKITTEKTHVTQQSVTQNAEDHGFALCPTHHIDPCDCGCAVTSSTQDMPLWKQRGFKTKAEGLAHIFSTLKENEKAIVGLGQDNEHLISIGVNQLVLKRKK